MAGNKNSGRTVIGQYIQVSSRVSKETKIWLTELQEKYSWNESQVIRNLLEYCSIHQEKFDEWRRNK